MADGGARKRKWDMPGPGGAAPAAAPAAAGPALAALPGGAAAPALAAQQALAVAQARAQAMAAAAAFAARLNAGGAAPSSAPAAAAEGVAQAFDLNDLEPLARGALTKRPVHEEVTRRTGCLLTTRCDLRACDASDGPCADASGGRGRYWPPGAARDEPALHLWVSPGASVAKESVEAQRGAVAAAIALLREHAAAASAPRGRPPPVAPYVPAPAMLPSYPAPQPPPSEVSTKLPLGFDCSSDPGFDAAARLRGPGGAYLAHVARQSGSAVELVGSGAGGAGESAEPLALLVRAPHAAALAAACALAGSLLATVSADWSRAHPDAPPPPPMPPLMPAPMPPGGVVGYAPMPYAAAVGHLAPGPAPYGAAPVHAYAPPPGGYAPMQAPYAAPPYGYAPVPPPGPPPPMQRASYASVAPPPSVMAGAQVVMAAAEEAAPQQQQKQQQQAPGGAAPAPRRFREFREAPPAELAPPPPSLAALAGYGEQDQHH